MSHAPSSDLNLVENILSGDRNAFVHIVSAHQDVIVSFVRRMAHDPVLSMDLSQEVFVRAFTRLGTFDGKKPLRPWLYRIALNLVRDHFRKPENRIFAENPGHDREQAAETTPETAWLAHERHMLLHKALNDLPKDLGEALILRFYQEMSFSDMAGVLGIGTSAAKMRVYRGLERMADMLDE